MLTSYKPITFESEEAGEMGFKGRNTREEIKETDDEEERYEGNLRRELPVLVSSRRICWLFGLLVGSVLNVDGHQLNSLNSSPTALPSTISFCPHNT